MKGVTEAGKIVQNTKQMKQNGQTQNLPLFLTLHSHPFLSCSGNLYC